MLRLDELRKYFDLHARGIQLGFPILGSYRWD